MMMNYEDTANYLGIAKKTLINWVWQDKIPHIKVTPRMTRFDKKQIDSWLNIGTEKKKKDKFKHNLPDNLYKKLSELAGDEPVYLNGIRIK